MILLPNILHSTCYNNDDDLGGDKPALRDSDQQCHELSDGLKYLYSESIGAITMKSANQAILK